MYEVVSQQFASCIRSTRSRSHGREFYHQILQGPGQRRPERQIQEVISKGQSAYQRISKGCRPRPIHKQRNRDSCWRTSHGWDRNSYPATSQNLWTNCTTKRTSSQSPTGDECRCNRLRLERRSEGSTGQPKGPTNTKWNKETESQS